MFFTFSKQYAKYCFEKNGEISFAFVPFATTAYVELLNVKISHAALIGKYRVCKFARTTLPVFFIL